MAQLSVLVLTCLALFLAMSWAQDEDGRCPYCVGKTCGPDGIGGSCGTCNVGERCYRGSCICDRGCTGFECGLDNCGTTCGECLPGQTCVGGLCTGACTPQCVRDDGSVRVCGWDRCGGCCGDCPEGFRCRDGTCECYPKCEDKHCGPDGCGGSCGTCEDDAFCQDEFDNFPGQCYFDCLIEVRIEVRERQTDLLVTGEALIDMTGPLGFFLNDIVYPGSVPGFVVVDISTGKFGQYFFVTTAEGYMVSNEEREITEHLQLITLYVDFLPILIEVRDEATTQLLGTADIAISNAVFSYNLNVDWSAPSFTWNHVGFGSYTFTTSASGYTTRTVTETVDIETSVVVLFLGKGAIEIFVEECVTGDSVATATITVGDQTINYSGGASFVPVDGFISYTFTTESSGYLSNVQTVSVTDSTDRIVLCVNYVPIPVIVTDCDTGALIDGASVSVVNSVYTGYSLTFTHNSAGTTWTPVGFSGVYTFTGTAPGYEETDFPTSVSTSTSEIAFCLPASAFCGDGFCNADEVANPTNANRCGDCGRIRGIISLAVGQKDQLQNITVSVWAHPTNPALFMRRGEAIPTADFVVQSDSKGSFQADRLDFAAPIESRAFGSYTRRFYFSLTGSFVDRTDNQDQTIQLLPLWWNYELVNDQYLGTGSTVGTNNSPSFYFYMTPPFTTNDALVRVILSWGTLLAQAAISIPDIDFVIAGPVDSTSMSVFGTGVVNFENKDLHAQTEILPFAKIISDSAQSFGPEVVDFYGDGTGGLGFSPSYAPGAAANVYEIWIDKPNSSPNEEVIFNYLSETNAFVVFYTHDGVTNEQHLFDELTGVEYAYGFFNGDQWNELPFDATLWHVCDIGSDGVIFDQFPDDGAGRKYGFEGGFYEPQKSLPCGHVAARGASPAYCPGLLTYPQSENKK